jgi:molybdate transport system ATP-binding protein
VIDLAFDITVVQGGFTLRVADRSRVEVLGLFGPSGAGKTTLLEAIAGLRRPSAGEIVVDGVTLFSSRAGIDVPPRQRHIGYVAAMLEIAPLLDRRVQGLSGGERQRVALGRALMTHPALLLLDEPLAAVDRARRERILPYLLRIRRELHVPLVYVTHDPEELDQIADRILVLDDGAVVKANQLR